MLHMFEVLKTVLDIFSLFSDLFDDVVVLVICKILRIKIFQFVLNSIELQVNLVGFLDLLFHLSPDFIELMLNSFITIKVFINVDLIFEFSSDSSELLREPV